MVVSSVDGIQGSEADFIIISTVRSDVLGSLAYIRVCFYNGSIAEQILKVR